MWFVMMFLTIGDQTPMMNWAKDIGTFQSQAECEAALTRKLSKRETLHKNAGGLLVISGKTVGTALYYQCVEFSPQ
jgi:hypothetical protein